MKAETQVQLETRKGQLVRLARAFCKEALPSGTKLVARASLQNLVNAAASTTSVDEVENYIRYQTSRLNDWGPRRDGRGQGFGRTLLDYLPKVAEVVHGCSDADAELHLEAVRHFFGYLLREAMYLKVEAATMEGGSQHARNARPPYPPNRRA